MIIEKQKSLGCSGDSSLRLTLVTVFYLSSYVLNVCSTMGCFPMRKVQGATVSIDTVNGERFAGLNFRVFHGFRSTAKVFP